MANLAVELHDSSLLTTSWSGRDVVLSMSVYLHQSTGRPGNDVGTGWTQDAELRIGTATLVVAPPQPLWILDGMVQVGAHVFDNLLPIPFDQQGQVVVRFSGANGKLEVTGVSATLILLGEPTFVEDVRPESN